MRAAERAILWALVVISVVGLLVTTRDLRDHKREDVKNLNKALSFIERLAEARHTH
jgi:hypothetical protein